MVQSSAIKSPEVLHNKREELQYSHICGMCGSGKFMAFYGRAKNYFPSRELAQIPTVTIRSAVGMF